LRGLQRNRSSPHGGEGVGKMSIAEDDLPFMELAEEEKERPMTDITVKREDLITLKLANGFGCIVIDAKDDCKKNCWEYCKIRTAGEILDRMLTGESK